MKKVNIYDAKARLSEYLELVQQGERVVICRRNQPVAELRPVPAQRTAPRAVGGSDIAVPASFFEPLPDDVLETFYGNSGDTVARRGRTAAEAPAAGYGVSAGHKRKARR